MKELQSKLITMLKGYDFEELKNMLNTQSAPEVRGAIMDAMEKYHEEKFNKWLEEC